MPFMAFKRNRNLRDIIGQKTIVNNKVKRNKDIITQKGWCSPCNSHGRNLCCRQMYNTNHFMINITKQKFKIHHWLNCRSKFVIYLLECKRCRIQLVGKSEWPMNIRVNKHRDVFRVNAILVCQHYNQASH